MRGLDACFCERPRPPFRLAKTGKFAHSRLDGLAHTVMIRAVMSWYYSKNGTQLGPISQEELLAKVRSGEVTPSDLVWKEGMPDWKPSGQVTEFQTTSVVSPTAPQYPANSMGSVPIPQPPAGLPGYPAHQTIPNHMVSSIIATVIGAILCWLVALPLGIVAIVFSSKVEALQLRGDIAGAMSASTTAKTWMICSFACSALLLVGFVVLLLIGAFSNV